LAVLLAQGEGLAERIQTALADRVAWWLDWRSDQRNAVLDCAELPLPAGKHRALGLDLLDLAAAVYLADLAVPRGVNEAWVRDIELVLAVREVDFWQAQEPALASLLQRLSGDNFFFEFHPRVAAAPAPSAAPWLLTDCACLVSGGLDSAAGAVLLLRTGRRPRLITHRSGNPTVAEAQDAVIETLAAKWPDQFRFSPVRLAPSSHRTHALPFPPPDRRENSRRCRSLFFLALGAVAAAAEGVCEVYLYDNGMLTAAVPLSEARSGGFTTHSTHPVVLTAFSDLLQAAGWNVRVLNPFLYQAKGEILRLYLQPVFSPAEIARTVSCWATGRRQRHCGGCVPCLLRRFALLVAGLPDEVYDLDLLGNPRAFVGTDAYRNLVDLLAWTNKVLSTPELRLPLEYPSLLEVQQGGAQVMDVVRALRRQAMEIFEVVHRHFPEAARLMRELP